MKRIFMAGLALAAAGLICSPLRADGPGDGPGWTGMTNPEDIIAAREALMLSMEEYMEPIDTSTVDPNYDPDTLVEAAETIAAMMLAVPHLFPPTTNVYDPDAEIPDTLALPTIWREFPTFYAMATATSKVATTMSETRDAKALPAAGLGLRASCDACHALYLRPYEEPEVTEEDRDFDFDSVFQQP